MKETKDSLVISFVSNRKETKECSARIMKKDLKSKKFIDFIQTNLEYSFKDLKKQDRLSKKLYNANKKEIKELLSKQKELLEEAKDKIDLVIVWEEYYFNKYKKGMSLYKMLKDIKK